ncbi:uncharacterized protein BDV14DRAFT_198852 [Aspergillus stella-maris]|uniref:uncharacterized protein n=1 Tax=Aspergillus stella-maris TaxID=1810926 RepID=UPI003CCDC51C
MHVQNLKIAGQHSYSGNRWPVGKAAHKNIHHVMEQFPALRSLHLDLPSPRFKDISDATAYEALLKLVRNCVARYKGTLEALYLSQFGDSFGIWPYDELINVDLQGAMSSVRIFSLDRHPNGPGRYVGDDLSTLQRVEVLSLAGLARCKTPFLHRIPPGLTLRRLELRDVALHQSDVVAMGTNLLSLQYLNLTHVIMVDGLDASEELWCDLFDRLCAISGLVGDLYDQIVREVLDGKVDRYNVRTLGALRPVNRAFYKSANRFLYRSVELRFEDAMPWIPEEFGVLLCSKERRHCRAEHQV